MEDFVWDVGAEEKLISLITYLNRNDVKVTLISSPYHPELYELMKSERPIFIEIEEKFKSIAVTSNTKIIGSYNPVSVGCSAEEFYDGMHPTVECMSKLLSKPNS